MKELLLFVKDKKFNVFVGRGTIPSGQKLLRLIYFNDFVKLSTVLWNLEFKIFGKYFFGACFALKTDFYKKVKPFFDIDKSLIIYQFGAEDLLLSRRCYYMDGCFKLAKNKVITSPRRFIADPIEWIMGARKNDYRQTDFKLDRKFINDIEKNKLTLVNNILENKIRKWFKYFIDALYFWEYTERQYEKSLIAAKNFLEFFNIPQVEIKKAKKQKDQQLFYKYFYVKHSYKSLQILKNYIRGKLDLNL